MLAAEPGRFSTEPRSAAGILDAGADPAAPVAVVASGTTEPRMTAPLVGIAGAAAPRGQAPPAPVVVGDVAGLRRELAWFGELDERGRGV